MNQRFLDMYTDYIFVEHPPAKADILFIPGSNVAALGEHAADLWRKGYSPVVVPSGRYSILTGHFAGVQDEPKRYPGPYGTEAEFLTDVLVKNGVDPEAVWPEPEATYTYENAIYSRRLTDARNLTVRKAILCCRPYHARRALLYYQLLYPECEFLVCPCKSDVTAANWYITKEGMELVLGEMERCGKQFHKIMEEILNN
ncbi:MAG TPA: hypothetical protein DF613_06015 [Lachnospiraceae bacterium]|nr:hypothetical protein [Lachnospiraceae bacterium]